MRTTPTFVFFHGGVFSQWHPSPFTLDGKRFSCAEQYHMYEKAQLMGDLASAEQILATTSPRKQKKIGRAIKGFKRAIWEGQRENIVEKGNKAKFEQNPSLLKELLATGDRQLVEAAPKDNVWGIGMGENDPRAMDPTQWQGENLLGKALMRVRATLGAATSPATSPAWAMSGGHILGSGAEAKLTIVKTSTTKRKAKELDPTGGVDKGEEVKTAASRPKKKGVTKSLITVQGDLVTCPTTLLCHQTNCNSKYALGLSKSLFNKFPYADIYKMRKGAASSIGTIGVREDPAGKAPTIVNMFGQVYPGKAKKSGVDSAENRLGYFRACLKLVAARPEAQLPENVITFPHNIGCGLGGGKWADYEQCLEDFSVLVPAKVILVQYGE